MSFLESACSRNVKFSHFVRFSKNMLKHGIPGSDSNAWILSDDSWFLVWLMRSRPFENTRSAGVLVAGIDCNRIDFFAIVAKLGYQSCFSFQFSIWSSPRLFKSSFKYYFEWKSEIFFLLKIFEIRSSSSSDCELSLIKLSASETYFEYRLAFTEKLYLNFFRSGFPVSHENFMRGSSTLANTYGSFLFALLKYSRIFYSISCAAGKSFLIGAEIFSTFKKIEISINDINVKQIDKIILLSKQPNKLEGRTIQ